MGSIAQGWRSPAPTATADAAATACASQSPPPAPTFAEAAEAVIELRKATYKPGSPSEANWRNSLKTYAFPKIGGLRVDAIGPAHIKRVLEPIWNAKRPTAELVKQRVHEVLKWAIGEGHRSDNPVDAAAATLPKAKVAKVKHRAAVPHGGVAAAIAKVRAGKARAVVELAFEFLVLTACRSGEVRGAR